MNVWRERGGRTEEGRDPKSGEEEGESSRRKTRRGWAGKERNHRGEGDEVTQTDKTKLRSK